MGKKKINLLLLLFMLLNIHTYSQQLFTENLHWKQQKEVVTELYESMQHLVNDTTPVLVECNKFNFSEMNLSDLFIRIFKRRKIDKQLTLQKQIRQNETKNYLDSNFVFVNDSVVGFGFESKIQITEWGKNQLPFSSVYPEDFRIKSSNIFILRVAGCSGLPCWNIYIFKEKDEFWQLIMMSTGARIRELFTINADNDLEKIIFRTKSGKIISELSYNVLDNEF